MGSMVYCLCPGLGSTLRALNYGNYYGIFLIPHNLGSTLRALNYGNYYGIFLIPHSFGSTLRALNYGNYGRFLIMGDAGSISSTVG